MAEDWPALIGDMNDVGPSVIYATQAREAVDQMTAKAPRAA